MASEVKWIKIVTDIFDDEKILLIEALPEADTIIVIWFKLLCLAGKLNSCGVLILNGRIAYTDEMLSQIFRRPLNLIRLALTTFEKFGMIEIVNDTITIPNWGKHQSVDRMMEIREYNRIKQRESRQRKKALLASGDDVNDNVNDISLTSQSSSISISISHDDDNTTNSKQDGEKGEVVSEKGEKQKTKTASTDSALFDRFWVVYPKKVSKKDAIKAFGKLNADEAMTEMLIAAVEKQKKSSQWMDGYIPNAATWLNGERWNDEYDEESEVRKREEHRRNYSGNQRESHTDYGLQPDFVDINARF